MAAGDVEALTSALSARWATSRSGATAGRGYHYQDLVGAWVGLRILALEIVADRLVAEGLEDLSCEGHPAQQVQVKSRQERVGDFRAGEAARHVLDTWSRRSERIAATAEERVVIVLERAVAGCAPADWRRAVIDDPACAELVAAIRDLAADRGVGGADVDALLAQTTIVVLPAQAIYRDASRLVAARTGLPLGATLPVVQALRAAVAEHADRNAEVKWDDRVGLSHTDLERIVTESAALVDRAALEKAVANGSCEPVDFDTPLPDAHFYAGTGTQPGHIAAGLVVARPGPTDAVLAGLGSGKAVLVAGPSGVGKSALMWMAGYVARHVVWYRVNRLGKDDVEPLIRLARAAGAGRLGPVGFVVDGIGTGALTSWDELHRRAAATLGILLLGSVREEDTLALETFGECVVVRPRLDEALAARIHAALLETRSTKEAHWREALDQADGLTLEFTHLLTRGSRLRDVVGEQVRDRVRGKRVVEVGVLAAVSVADRWGATLDVPSLSGLVTAPDGELKLALSRLVDEHLIVVDHGIVRGLHPLRSAVICDAVHDVPPPTLDVTLCAVIGLLADEQLSSFLARVLADEHALATGVLDKLGAELSRPDARLSRTAAALGGLRLADFTVTARAWAEVLERHDVALPLRSLAIDLAMIGSDLVEGFDPRLIASVEEIRAGRDEAQSPLRDALIAVIGTEVLHRLLEEAPTAGDASALLAPLALTGLDFMPLFSEGVLCRELRAAPLEDVAELMSTAALVSPGTARVLLDAAGGPERIVERLQQANPWLLDIAIVELDDEKVIRGRVLHVSDRHNGDPEKSVKALAVLALRCLPDMDRADLTTVLAGGVLLSINGFEPGTSHLHRQYVHSSSAVAWNQARSRFARSLVGDDSTTTRLFVGLSVLERSAEFLADLADAWVTDRGTGRRLARLNQERDELLLAIQALAPRLPQSPLGEPGGEGEGMLDNDPVHGVAQGIVQNLAARLTQPSQYGSLAAFAADTLQRQVDDSTELPWGLMGLDQPPPVLARLRVLLGQLAAVLAELAFGDTTTSEVRVVARAVPRGAALRRVADRATARAKRRYQRTTAALAADAAAMGFQIEVLSREDPDATGVEWPPLRTAVLAHLDTVDLGTVHAGVADLLTRHTLPDSSVVLIPVRNGAALIGYTVRMYASGNLYPLPAEVEPWLDIIPPPLPTPCVDAVADAIEALRELSSIAYLDAHRDCGEPAQAAADDAVARLENARERIADLAEDRLTVALSAAVEELVARVQSELDDLTTAEYFAEEIARGVIGESSGVPAVVGLLDLATEWDVDPTAAVALFDAADEVDPAPEPSSP